MSINRQMYNTKNRSKKRRKRILLSIVMPVLLLIIGATAYGGFLYNKAESVMNKSYKPIERETKLANTNVDLENTSILFIGVDDSEKRKSSGNSRSDALML